MIVVSVSLALAEMYVQGVSGRKVITVLQKLVGPEINISSTQISRCVAKLEEGLEAWRNRALGATPYMVLDALRRYAPADRWLTVLFSSRWALTKPVVDGCWAYRLPYRRPKCIGETFSRA